MKTFRVTYYYLATGMEGRPDEQDYGNVQADSADEAKNIVTCMHGGASPEWFKGCLTAVEVTS